MMRPILYSRPLFALLTLCLLVLSVSLVGIQVINDDAGTDGNRAEPPFPDRTYYTPPSISNVYLIGEYTANIQVNTTNITANFGGTSTSYDSGLVQLQLANCILVQIYSNSRIIIFIHDNSMLNAKTVYGFFNRTGSAWSTLNTTLTNSGEYPIGEIEMIMDLTGYYTWYNENNIHWSAFKVYSSYASWGGTFMSSRTPDHLYGQATCELNNVSWDSAILNGGSNNIGGAAGDNYFFLDASISSIALVNYSAPGGFYDNTIGVLSSNDKTNFLNNQDGNTDTDGDGYYDSEEGNAGTSSTDPKDHPIDTDKDGTYNYEDNDDDGDGVSDEKENSAGTDPLDSSEYPPDTDGDGAYDFEDNDDDNDGFTDTVEQTAGSDPLNQSDTPKDTDGDMQYDYEDDDDDNDGFSDMDESTAGTNSTDPNSYPDWDSDGDGFRDWQEYQNGTDPKDSQSYPWMDSDGDMFMDHEEYQDGTDPFDETDYPMGDSDGDGFPNLEEKGDGTDYKDPENYPFKDSDFDGVNDWEEIQAGTNRTDPEDYPPQGDDDPPGGDDDPP